MADHHPAFTKPDAINLAAPELSSLTIRERAFVMELIVDLDFGRAYLAAGYKATGKSNPVAAAHGLASKPHIKAALAYAQQDRLHATGVTGAEVIKELARIAFADFSQAMDAHGEMLPMSKWPKDLIRALASLDVERRPNGDALAKIRFWDKISALHLLCKHLNLLQPEEIKGELVVKWADE